MKIRQSNFELLRIVAMLLVMILHCCYFSLGMPDKVALSTQPTSSFLCILGQSSTVMCVDVFVMISGWFGIRANKKSLLSLLFQCFFIIGLTDIYFYAIGTPDMTLRKCISGTFFFSDSWFVRSYILLYILSPLLNAFISSSNETTKRKVIIPFFVIMCTVGWLDIWGDFHKGYSTLSFIGLYLLANYVHQSKAIIFRLPKRYDILIFFILVFVQAGLEFVALHFGTKSVLNYNSPFTIAEALYLLLFFSKLNFNSNAINWIATSAFAIYLFHASTPLLWAVYKPFVQNAKTLGLPDFIGNIVLLIVVVFTFAILFDRVRILCWHFLLKVFNR